MLRWVPACILIVLLTGTLLTTPTAQAQTTWYVDDDAPNDPGPGNPTLSDPNENGSPEHPFDAIQEGIDAASDGDMVLVLDGTYTGTGNKRLDFAGKEITVRSENGPESCIIDCEGVGRGFVFNDCEPPGAVADGFTVMNALEGVFGGAILCRYGGTQPTVVNCRLVENDANERGAGVYCMEGAAPVLINCVIAGNDAGQHGGGVACDDAAVTLVNCTIAGNNVATGGGGGLRTFGESSVTMANCVVWDNSAPNGAQIRVGGSSTVIVAYSDVEGGEAAVSIDGGCTLNWGDGNIDADPLFVDPNNGDYHLSYGSPCIDTGTNDPPGGLPATDFEGDPRPIDGDGDVEPWTGQAETADMGADETEMAPVPVICLTPTDFIFAAPQGGPDPNDQTLLIRNCGAATLNWEIAENCPWLTADPNSGESAGETDEIALIAHAAGLTPGLYVCELQVFDPQAANTPQTVEATLHIYRHLCVPGEYPTIQAAIDDAAPGDVVLVADGTYSGAGNKNLDFGGKAITVRSENGSAACIIDCEGSARGFHFHSGETQVSVVDGFTVMNGNADEGGGIRCYNNSNPTLINCVITDNQAISGGGVFCRRYSSPLIAGCVITGNRADEGGVGGGLGCYRSSPTIVDCTITLNTASTGAGGVFCTEYSSPTITDCVISDNATTTYGGAGLYCSNQSSPKITRCVITRNTSAMGGGGMSCRTHSSPTVVKSVISDNTAADFGGGIHCTDACHPVFVGCEFARNWARRQEGGGVWCYGGSVTLTNCTITENTGGRGGGLFCKTRADVTLANCILYGNSLPNIRVEDVSTVTISYSDVQGGLSGIFIEDPYGSVVCWGLGNIDADPLFVDPNNGDYRLGFRSPCVDAGDNTAVPADNADLDDDGDTDEPTPFDLDGNPRFVDDPATPDTGNGTAPIVDMGAYEFQTTLQSLDIKPGSCPNPLNVNSHGVVPMAVVGTVDFDVTQIDANSLVLTRADGVGGAVTPLMGPPGPKIRVEDVATPFEGEPCDCHELAGDGIDDLSMKFDTEVVVSELELDGLAGGAEVELVVSGELLDGTRFGGADCVSIVPPAPGSEPPEPGSASDPPGPDSDAEDGQPDTSPTGQPVVPDAGFSVGDSSQQDVDADRRARPSASEQDDTDADYDEDTRDASFMPIVGCGPISPALLLATLAATRLLRRW